MPGKLIENLKYQQVIKPAQRTGTTALYNGVSATTGVAIDTKGFDEVNIILNAGTSEGSSSVAAAVYSYTSDDPASSSAISGADFTAVTTSTDDAIQTASIVCRDTDRYLWLRTIDTTGATSYYSADAVLGKYGVNPQSNSPVFDL